MSNHHDDYLIAQAVRIILLPDHSATVARVSYDGVAVSGSAKREPGDEYDPETGRLLAASRALDRLASRLRKRADGRIRNAAAIQRHHQEIRARLRKPASDPAIPVTKAK